MKLQQYSSSWKLRRTATIMQNSLWKTPFYCAYMQKNKKNMHRLTIDASWLTCVHFYFIFYSHLNSSIFCSPDRSSEFIENAARICQRGSWVPCWCCVANVFALAVIEGINSFVVVCWDRRLLDFESILVNLLTGESKPVKNRSLST